MIIKDRESFHKIIPSQGKLLAIDVGTKRIGIADCDETRILFTPKKIITRRGNEKDFAEIKQIFYEGKMLAIVIGFPINMDGSLNAMSYFVENFSANLNNFLDNKVNIFFADERLTSFEAKDISSSISSRKKQKYYDDIAASIILRDFILAINNFEI